MLDLPAYFHGHIALHASDAGVMPWRLPEDRLDLFHPALVGRAACAAGVRLSLTCDSSRLTVAFAPPDHPAAPPGVTRPDAPAEYPPFRVDLCVDGRLHQQLSGVGHTDEARFTDIPAGSHRLDVWLPQDSPVRVAEVKVDDGAKVALYEDDRPRWLTYGSSITQCAAAESPALTWPAIVANTCDLNLTCLGFGGNCKLETTVARLIRDTPADAISLCLGINVHGELSPRVFREQALGLIQLIREKQPDPPIVAISPIHSPPRETAPSNVGHTLEAMREQIADAVEKLRARGDANLHYVSGLDLFGPDLLPHLPDELHPNAEGYKHLAQNFIEHVVPRFHLDRQRKPDPEAVC